jgi:hypothetical protein
MLGTVMNAGATTERSRKIKVVQFPAPVRRLLIPREHGSWGLWLLPLITGAIVGAAHVHHSSLWPIFWLLIAAFSAFLAYQPLEALLGSSPYKVRSTIEKKIVAGWVLLCTASGVLAAVALVMLGRGRVLWFGALGAACFGARFLLSRARKFRITRQILGALSLSSTAAAAYFVNTGTLDTTAMLLWTANWLFAVGQIEYVQVRVRMTVQSRAEKLRASLGISLYHVVLLYFASIGATKHMVHPLFAIAFLPAVLRILVWAGRKPAKTNFHVLGFSELFQSVLFSGLLLAAFLQP